MPTVSRTFTVTPPPHAVLGFLKDFGNAEKWDPGTQSCQRTDSGPVTVGSTWHNVSKIAGITTELTYTLKELTDSRVVFEGKNSSATSLDTIVVEPVDDGSRLRYRADLTMHGLAVVMAPAMKLLFEKIAGDTEKQLTGVLNALPV